ncbi:MAG: VOC family protein [Candidatus Nanopelagicales bacterium]
MSVRQLRFVVTVDDHDDVVQFFREALGMPVEAAYQGPGDARVTILDAGRATLEVINREQAEYIDEVEVGRRVAGQVRLALEVEDVRANTARATRRGAAQTAPPTTTAWHSRNARLEAPGGIHLTLFQELGEGDSVLE